MATRSNKPPPLSGYQKKRDFNITPEPAPQAAPSTAEQEDLAFVIQKHWASRLHYDFRLELDGALISWAVPKGPSYDPKEKRMAIHVEDHPVSYADFEGTIPPKQYGAGAVIVWDRGTWEPVEDPHDGMKAGKLIFRLHGEKLAGLWELVRISKPEDKQDQWMLFKKRDEWAQPLAQYDVIKALPDSVIDKPLGLVEEREPKPKPRTQPLPEAKPEIDLSLAVTAALPAKLEPQLATLAASLPRDDGWIVETKFEGYRMLARIDNGQVRLFTRGGQDWTNKLKSLASEVEQLRITAAWLDGELVVLKDGLPDFNALQNAITKRHDENIVYFLFDVPYWDGQDLRKVPLSSRRALLQQLIGEPTERIRISQHFDAPPAQVFQAACDLGLEGLMFKRRDAPYVSMRTQTWLKAKCRLRQEFVICGFTNRSGASQEVGSLLLGYHVDGKLRYAGNVGTGWDAETARDLWTRLSALEVSSAQLDAKAVKRRTTRTAGSEHWVQPLLVAEVAFAEWTPAGHVRQASFKGLRTDKPASDITRDAGKTAAAAPAASSVKVTNPERVIDPIAGITKLDLVRYYESVADWMLPHLKDRPLSMLRAPNGITEALFFQKHPETKMPGLKEHDPNLWPDHAALLTVDTLDALVSAAQLNVVEFHTWNSTVKRLDKPDRVIFDLDPGEGLNWLQVQEAALLVHTLLTELELKAWLKTSGGKGLHIVVPLAPRLDYDAVKGFSKTFVQHLVRTIPERFTATSGPSNRKGKVFVDYLRNGMGQTTVAAFSARARPGLGVSMPVAWEQLMSVKGGAQWTVATAREYLSFQTECPWAEYWSTKQTLTSAMKRLGLILSSHID